MKLLKTSIVFLFVLIAQLGSYAQQDNVVEWKTGYNEKTKEVEVKAQIKDGWHLYSLTLESDEGPLATEVVFDKSEDYKTEGEVKEKSNVITVYDKNFEMNVRYFEHSAVFAQKVSTNKENITVTGRVTFMVCDDSRCLPPTDVKFEVEVK